MKEKTIRNTCTCVHTHMETAHTLEINKERVELKTDRKGVNSMEPYKTTGESNPSCRRHFSSLLIRSPMLAPLLLIV